MKKFLAAQDITSPKQLQRQLDRFVSYYNEERPHRGIGRKTPASVYAATGEGHALSVIRQGGRSTTAL